MWEDQISLASAVDLGTNSHLIVFSFILSSFWLIGMPFLGVLSESSSFDPLVLSGAPWAAGFLLAGSAIVSKKRY